MWYPSTYGTRSGCRIVRRIVRNGIIESFGMARRCAAHVQGWMTFVSARTSPNLLRNRSTIPHIALGVIFGRRSCWAVSLRPCMVFRPLFLLNHWISGGRLDVLAMGTCGFWFLVLGMF